MARITLSDLIRDAADDEFLSQADAASLYARRSSVEDNYVRGRSLLIGAADLEAGTGVGTAPAATHQSNRWRAWIFDDDTAERVTGLLDVPDGWGSVDIDVIHVNPNAGTGNLVLDVYLTSYADGETSAKALNAAANDVVVAAGEQNVVTVSRVATDVSVTEGVMASLMIDRLGAHASNTLNGTWSLIAVRITRHSSSLAQLVSDGAICWFNDPRLITHAGTHRKMYGAYVMNGGSIAVASLDLDSGEKESFVLHAALQDDDHDVPGLIVMPDGHLLAFYSKHSVDGGVIYWRRSTNPEDVSAWDAEQTIATGSVSYPKPALVGDRLYVFFRGIAASHPGVTTNQVYIYSDDDGATWSTAKRLFQAANRPYFHMTDSHDGRIDFLCTDGHPRENPNTDLFHFYLEGANLYKTDGTLIGALSGIASAGLGAADVTKIYDDATNGQAWGWDISLDPDGNPRCVFATFPGAEDDDHRLHYGRWDGDSWNVTEITAAGGAIGDGSEEQYSGGIGMLRPDLTTVYLSREVSGTFEIERWTTDDDGATWTNAESITSSSATDQIRPTCPRDYLAGAPDVVWMSGSYITYLNFATRLVMHPAPGLA